MELTSVTQQLSQQIRQTNTDTLAKLVETGAIKPNAILSALVNSVEVITQEQRDQLSALWNKNLLSLPTKAAGSPQENTNTPLQQALSSLLKQPVLRLIELKLFNTTQLAVTDQSLLAGQRVPVILRQDLQLQLLPSNVKPSSTQIAVNNAQQTPLAQSIAKPTSGTGAPTSVLGEQHVATATKPQSTISSELLKPHSSHTISAQTEKSLTSNVHQGASYSHSLAEVNRQTSAVLGSKTIIDLKPHIEPLKQLLRENMPIEKSVASTINTLSIALTKAALLAPPVQQQLLENATWKLLTQFVNSAIKPSQISQPQQLKNFLSAVKNSTVPTNTNTAQTNKTTLTTRNGQTSETKQPQSNQPQPPLTDIKTLLQSINTQIQSLTTTPAPRGSASAALLFNALTQLQGLTQTTQSTKQHITTARSQIQELTQSALAKITTMQVQHLLNQTKDRSVQPSGGIIELPIRISDTVVPLMLYIQEKWYTEQESTEANTQKKEKKTKQKKRWHVFMEFDLENDGALACQLDVVDKKTTTRFWAEKNELKERVKTRLNTLKQTLENDGIVVSEISLSEGKAPVKQAGLDLSLIDVRT